VYSSVRGGDRPAATNIDHADSKQIVEAYFREGPVRATVLGPVYFMENVLNLGFSRLGDGRWAGEEVATMFESFENNTDFLDIEALHARYRAVRWHSYAEWAKTVDWDRILAG
jgi:hypothetical protein